MVSPIGNRDCRPRLPTATADCDCRLATSDCRLWYNSLMSDAPKSSLELVMERLRRKDAESGVQERSLTDAQRAAIAEARNLCEARIAERKILHQSALATMLDPAERAQREEELRRDIEQLESDRDSKISRIRAGTAAD
jgi:hypothetical protein